MRKLTDLEYEEFVLWHPLLTYSSLPPWGGVIEWNNKAILVYFAPDTHKMFLTDVTDHPDIIDNQSTTFDPATLSMWYYLPSELMKSINVAAGNIASMNPLKPEVLIPLAVVLGLVLILRR